MTGSVPDGPAPGGVTTHRLVAARRRAMGLRLRRVVPGLVVGTTTLAGTGGLVAWVSHQPGLQVSTASRAVAPPVSTTSPTDPAVVSAVQHQLQQEEAALRALQARMTQLSRQAAASRASAGDTGGAGTGAQGAGSASGSGSGFTPLPALPPLPALSAPVVAAPPAAIATTGASHAVP